ARAGHQVTVFEASSQVGGAAITREFAPGFKVSAAAHLVYMLDPGIEKELDLASHGLEYARTGLQTISLSEEGDHVRFNGDDVDGVSEGDREAMREYRRKMQRFAGIIGGLHNRVPARLGTTDRPDLLELARLAFNIRRLGKNDMREFLRIAGINIYDVLQELFENDALKGALGLDGTLGTMLGTRSNNSVFCALHRYSNGGRYQLPKGGMGTVSNALANAARAFGAEIHTARPVNRILMDFDRATGVELQSGEQIEADLVVSGADPKTTFLKLLGAQNLEAGFAHKISNIRTRGNVAKLHLALGSVPDFTGLDPALSAERLVIAPSLQYVEQAFNHAKYGEHSRQPVMEISIPTLDDPGLAPAGKHVLSANVQWAPRELKGGWSAAHEAFTESVMNTLERFAPGICSQVMHRELLTPQDIESEFRIEGGHWHHAELALDQSMMMRPVPGTAQYKTPVDGLWICGAGCHPGGGVMGSAGRNAARAIIERSGT
ncbi:MAG: NAD(P)/FAD-dependent oxidoreductase, partial [Xanthomonadales bacterium]|nr:NAD(P)/FAD-dependent oxidoreductase [Xanthomonadales bacterium]